MHLLHKRLVEVLHDAIKLWGVMDSEPACGACVCEVLVKCSAEVFTATVRVQDLNGSTEILGACPCLEGVVHVKSVALVHEKEGDGGADGIVCECDKEMVPLAHRHGGGSLDIGMYLITKMGGLLTDADFQDRLVGCACIDACVAMLLVQLRVKHNPCHQSALDKLVCGHGCNMPYVAVQLHDANDLDSIAALLM